MVRLDVSSLATRARVIGSMKILVVASLAESLVNFRGPLIKAFQEKGLDVHVAAPDFSSSHETRIVLESKGITTHQITMSRTGMNPLADARCLWSLWVLMLNIRPDVMFAYTIKPVIYGTIAASLVGVRRRFVLITGLGYAFTGRVTGLRLFAKSIAQQLYGIALKKATKIFFQNPDDESCFKELRLIPENGLSFVVNGSGVDVASFDVVPLPANGISFLLIARLLGDKGVREYVGAARLVRKSYPSVRFRLVGWIDGNPDAIDQTELDQWIDEGIVEYLGKLNDVRGAIADCSVYVLPSYREGTPRTVLEAMAMGRAIITTDAPGCRETVVNGLNGFLVPVKSVVDLANAMLTFLQNQGLADHMGCESRKLAEEKYDVHKVNAVMLTEMGIA